MILFYLLATIVAICNGQNAELSYQENCFNVLGTLTIQAKYTGTGTPQSVVWSYSAIPGSFLTVLPGSCTIFGGSIPAGFPAGITLKCPDTDSLPANTYQLIVSDLLSNESDKTWGVTFTPPVGVAPGAVNLAVPALCTTTTTTTSTTSTTAFTSSTTTIPATTRTTPATTRTTPATVTKATPDNTKTTTLSTTTTTPASTTQTMPITTTSMSMPITTSMLPTTSTNLTSKSKSSTKSSNDGLSDEMIIVIVIVPVGVIAIVGTVIFVCLFYRLRRGERKPTSHERHKLGKHYKGNMRPVQQHQQQPYILYGRGHTRESNHKETKRSRSLHDDRYNWFDGYHWQNPVYKDDRNLSRLYYNETLPQNDDYRSGYTTGHVYPSRISSYQYRPDYHGDSRRHGNSQYSSYPVYSRQQEYINSSYSYMGY